MITYRKGLMLEETNATTLVNSVNTVGVMGKGIALAFKQKYPWHFEMYKATCSTGNLVVGKPVLFKKSEILKMSVMGFAEPMNIERFSDPDIICFPSKKHWRNPSELSWITEGLEHITRMRDFWYPNQHMHMAIPLLGTDNGGLDKQLVSSLIKEILGKMTNCDIEIWRL